MRRRKTIKELLYEFLYELFIKIYLVILLIVSFTVMIKTGNIFLLPLTMMVGMIGVLVIQWLIKEQKEKIKQKIVLESGIDIVDEMSGEAFEEFLLAHFMTQGYKGYITPRTDDYGADLVIEKDGRKIVVQAKRWKKVVGIEAVQQVVSAIKHYDAHKGMVITNSSFTENAYELASSNGIELWDRKILIEFMKKYKDKEIAQNIAQKDADSHVTDKAAAAKEEVCPWCGRLLVLRDGKKGEFWGCTGFPRCRYTRNV